MRPAAGSRIATSRARAGRHHGGHHRHGGDNRSLGTIASLSASVTSSVAVIGGVLVLAPQESPSDPVTDTPARTDPIDTEAAA